MRYRGWLRILDRYLLRQFFRIFAMCVLGVPFIFIVINMTDDLDRHLAEGVGGLQVLLHYVYGFPYQALLAFPIAALLAAVFTVSNMTRHFETTAAKANGVSFYRLTAPLVLAALGVSLVALGLTELVPRTNQLAEEALGNEPSRSETLRNDFVYRAEEGRIYVVQRLDAREGVMEQVSVEREGTGWDYPTYDVSSPRATWDSAAGRWFVGSGRLRLMPERGETVTFRFEELWQRPFTETPEELLAEPKDPDHMGYFELDRYIEAIQRSGGTARDLLVEQELKVAIPFTCLIIVLFGAPLAHSTRRGGAPLSIGIALATTIFFLMLIRVSQALGAGGTVPPRLAAWLPNLLFLAAGLWLYAKVRT